MLFKLGQQRKPVHFHRFRNKRGLTKPDTDTQGNFRRLTFDKPVQDPLAFGFVCHYLSVHVRRRQVACEY